MTDIATVRVGARTWLEAAAVTHPGLKRAVNEDRAGFWPLPRGRGLVVGVADGIGGHGGGEQAAELALTALANPPYPSRTPLRRYEHLLGRFHAADTAIREAGASELGRGAMGTTLVAAVATRRELLHLHAGDSRLYVFRDGALLHRTKDHSIVQVLLDLGKITPDQARTHPMRAQLTSSLGGVAQGSRFTADPPWVEGSPAQPAFHASRRGDVVLLCTDGLSGELPDDALPRLFCQPRPLTDIARDCLAAVLATPASDNVGFVVLRWV